MFKPVAEFKVFWSEVPKQVQVFLIRAFVIFIVWKFAYHLVLKPYRVIDKPLTTIVGRHTEVVLKKIYPNNTFTLAEKLPNNKIDFFVVNIYKDGKKALGIADPCNALELIILYVAFLLAMFTNWKRIVLFSFFGLILIYICNIIRCTTIGYLNIQRSWTTEIAHHYVFKLIMYCLIFLGWVLYMKGEEKNA